MVKSPIEYFQEQNFSLDQEQNREISPAERIFLQKYLGIDGPSPIAAIAPVEGKSVLSLASPAQEARPEGAPAASAPAAQAGSPAPISGPEPLEPEISIEEMLKENESVTLVGFFVSGNVFVIPIDVVLEVIHYEEPYKLPMAPSYMVGVVNLRGRVLPVISLPELIMDEQDGAPPAEGKGLIIICEARGLRIGLLIDRLHTMYKAVQEQITWNADAHLGPSAELLSGLLETGEKLVGMVSIEKIVAKILDA